MHTSPPVNCYPVLGSGYLQITFPGMILFSLNVLIFTLWNCNHIFWGSCLFHVALHLLRSITPRGCCVIYYLTLLQCSLHECVRMHPPFLLLRNARIASTIWPLQARKSKTVPLCNPPHLSVWTSLGKSFIRPVSKQFVMLTQFKFPIVNEIFYCTIDFPKLNCFQTF